MDKTYIELHTYEIVKTGNGILGTLGFTEDGEVKNTIPT